MTVIIIVLGIIATLIYLMADKGEKTSPSNSNGLPAVPYDRDLHYEDDYYEDDYSLPPEMEWAMNDYEGSHPDD